MLEAGAGTGGLTKDALPLFETDMHHELLRYCATDITSAFSGGLLDAVKSPKLIFKARPSLHGVLERSTCIMNWIQGNTCSSKVQNDWVSCQSCFLGCVAWTMAERMLSLI